MSLTQQRESKRSWRPKRATAVSAALAILLGGLLASCSPPRDPSLQPSAATPTASGIGDWPSFLPSPPRQTKTATGDASNPALSFQGMPVIVSARHGQLTINVNGPEVPVSGVRGATDVTCTFTVAMSDATGTFPVNAGQFDVLASSGGVHSLKPIADHPIPGEVSSGQSVTFLLRGSLPDGEGLVRYRPDDSGVAAVWDYVAEID